jgi:hypothetical protein
MIREKFSTEKKERRYGNLKIARASDLPAAFFSDRAIKAFHENWDKSVGGQLLFLPSELEQAADQTLTSSKNVEQLVRDFWQPTLEAL